MFHPLLLLVVGLALVWKGADLLVDGGSALATKLGVSPLVVGLTVVSFGTSAPELAVNVTAALEGAPGLALGNVLGSNLANILLVLGVAAVLRPLRIERRTVWVELPVATVAVLVLALLLNDQLLAGRVSQVDRIDGLILLVFFALFLYYLILMIRQAPHTTDQAPSMSTGRSGVYVVAGAVGLGLGAIWLVDGATWAAAGLGIPENVVGLTVVALGTSLPELVTSTVAAAKGSSDIAVGNVVGSNIFNIFLVLGLTATLHPVPSVLGTNVDLLAVGIASVALMLLVAGNRDRGLDRGGGSLLLLLYGGC